MIDRLEQLTIAQFVDLVCGDSDLLIRGKVLATEKKIQEAVENIIFEYKEIADPTGAKIYLADMEELAKAKISLLVFTMCENLVQLEEFGRIREILKEYGINAASMNDQRVAAEIKSRIGRSTKEIEQIKKARADNKSEPQDVRRYFDEQTAAMMAYFKFQIDTSTMKASIYAHLVARFNRDVRAQLAAMKKK